MSAIRMMLTVLLLASGCFSAYADDGSDDASDSSPEAVARFPQPISVGWLIGRTVLQPIESQPVLGHVRGVRMTGDGQTQVIVNYGGIFGFGARPIAVPLTSVVLLGQYVEIIDLTHDQLSKLPTYEEKTGTALPGATVIKVGLARPSH